MSFQDDLLLWNHAALKVVDVRRAVIQPGDSLRAHQLTAGSFLCTVQGKARVLLDEAQYQAGPYHVCHAGKGTVLAIDYVQEALEYYLLQYKATLALPCREELLRLQQKRDPFQLAHSFTPRYPLPLFGTVRQMHEKWQKASMLDRLHAKALLHQFVYEWLQPFVHKLMQERLRVEPVQHARLLPFLVHLADCAKQRQRIARRKAVRELKRVSLLLQPQQLLAARQSQGRLVLQQIVFECFLHVINREYRAFSGVANMIRARLILRFVKQHASLSLYGTQK